MNLLHRFLFWVFQKEIRDLPAENLTREQIDTLLSGMWQNPVFRNYLIKRDRDLTIEMRMRFSPKKDDMESAILYGRTLELMELHNTAKFAYNRRQEEFTKKKESRSSSQVSA